MFYKIRGTQAELVLDVQVEVFLVYFIAYSILYAQSLKPSRCIFIILTPTIIYTCMHITVSDFDVTIDYSCYQLLQIQWCDLGFWITIGIYVRDVSNNLITIDSLPIVGKFIDVFLSQVIKAPVRFPLQETQLHNRMVLFWNN